MIRILMISLLFSLSAAGQDQVYTDNQVTWLKTYIDAEFKAVRDAVGKVEKTNADAVNKVEETNTNYRATQNEWRGQIKDQTQTFVTRSELWSGLIAAVTIMLAIVGTIIAILSNRKPKEKHSHEQKTL